MFDLKYHIGSDHYIHTEPAVDPFDAQTHARDNSGHRTSRDCYDSSIRWKADDQIYKSDTYPGRYDQI